MRVHIKATEVFLLSESFLTVTKNSKFKFSMRSACLNAEFVNMIVTEKLLFNSKTVLLLKNKDAKVSLYRSLND